MNAQELLQEISDYCRQSGLAESTFGRRAVNDGKLASRLRNGGRITTETLDRIRAFMESHRQAGAVAAASAPRLHLRATAAAIRCRPTPHPSSRRTSANRSAAQFPLLRQPAEVSAVRQHLLAKSGWWRAASRSSSPTSIRARRRCACSTPASATARVLARVMRAMHDRFPHMPFYIVGKEISLEDVRLDLAEDGGPLLRASGDRAGADQPRLCGCAVARGEVAERRLQHGLARGAADRATRRTNSSSRSRSSSRSWRENWKAGVSPKTGNPVYERPVVLVIYREDHHFLLDPIIPRPGGTIANYDLVIASQPYRARASLDFKAKRVIAPLARALGPGGRLIAHPFATATIPAWRSSRRSGRATTRSSTTATRSSRR